MILLWVALSMFAKDGICTLLTVAEAKGRASLAGALDALGDIATVVSTVYGAGEIVLHGWNLAGLEILAVMCVTSLIGTTFWTRLGRHIVAHVAVWTPPASYLCRWCRAPFVAQSDGGCAACGGPV